MPQKQSTAKESGTSGGKPSRAGESPTSHIRENLDCLSIATQKEANDRKLLGRAPRILAQRLLSSEPRGALASLLSNRLAFYPNVESMVRA
jgi:hypothetical protein